MGKRSFPLHWFYHCHGQIPDRNNLRKEGLIWLTVAEVSTHCGKEGMGSRTSCHGGQETEQGSNRKRLMQDRFPKTEPW